MWLSSKKLVATWFETLEIQIKNKEFVTWEDTSSFLLDSNNLFQLVLICQNLNLN